LTANLQPDRQNDRDEQNYEDAISWFAVDLEELTDGQSLA
jgi:hypothetical protein